MELVTEAPETIPVEKESEITETIPAETEPAETFEETVPAETEQETEETAPTETEPEETSVESSEEPEEESIEESLESEIMPFSEYMKLYELETSENATNLIQAIEMNTQALEKQTDVIQAGDIGIGLILGMILGVLLSHGFRLRRV